MIVHLGAGNFHRAHQAAYLDALGDPDWRVCAVGTRPEDAAVRDALRAQDCRYTLRLLHGDGRVEGRVIGSIAEYVFAPDEPDVLMARLVAPPTRIVSLTITEGGYVGNDELFGIVARALTARRDAGVAPFTVMSCDNIVHNGAVARAAVVHAADASDTAWIEDTVAFPNSMVDRIAPATTDGNYAVVAAEPFAQWVLEDTFGNGRPALERVGVQLVGDVAPYEAMKLRLLNGTHQAIAYAGLLLGHAYVHEAMGDASIDALVRAYLTETALAVPPVAGVDLDGYCLSLRERFANPYIADTLARVQAHPADRLPTFVLPAISDNRRAGRAVPVGSLVCALAAHYLGSDELVGDVPLDTSRDLIATRGVRAAIDAICG